MGKYRKAIWSAIIAGLATLSAALLDGAVTGEEIGAIVGSVAVAGGVVWRVPNQ